MTAEHQNASALGRSAAAGYCGHIHFDAAGRRLSTASVVPAAVQPQTPIEKKEPMSTMMTVSRATTTVKLSSPVEWFGKAVSEVVIEEPTAAVYFKIGDPVTWYYGADGGGTPGEVPDMLTAYAEHMLKIDNGAHFLAMIPMRDGRAIKKAMLGFFRDAPAETSS